MIARCIQLFAGFALLALVAGAPTQAYAHGGHAHPVSSKSLETAPPVIANHPVAAKPHSLSATSDRPDQPSHQKECGSCCACNGGSCQSAATLPAFAADATLRRDAPDVPYDAISPPRRAQTSLEHPPKPFA